MTIRKKRGVRKKRRAPQEELKRLEAQEKSWMTKLKRATTALGKIQSRRTYYERRLEETHKQEIEQAKARIDDRLKGGRKLAK